MIASLKSVCFTTFLVLITVLFLYMPLVDADNKNLYVKKNEVIQPLTSFAHGSFFSSGKKTVIDKELVLFTQKYYIEQLRKQSLSDKFKNIFSKKSKKIEQSIYQLVRDDILANALFIDWLIENIKPQRKAHLTSINYSMRSWYLREINQKDRQFKLKPGQSSKGIEPKIAKQLEEVGVSVFYLTNANGKDYIEECRDAGVPIPPPIFASVENPALNQWQHVEKLEGEFIITGDDAEVWGFLSEDSEGVCVALPRYITGTKTTNALGVICLNKKTGDACFWDNAEDVNMVNTGEGDGYSVTDTEKFVGGTDLYNGVCSDCHAGENPFIVHPSYARGFDDDGNAIYPYSAFDEIIPWLQSEVWHKPHVKADWPQNPGPSNLLAAFPEAEGKCTNCHFQGNAGRFPELSTELPDYCNFIFGGAIGESEWPLPVGLDRPPSMPTDDAHRLHIDVLKAACERNPGDPGIVVDVEEIPDDDGFVSSPLTIGPLYACSQQVAVQGGIVDAQISLFIDDGDGPQLVGSTISRNPANVTFDVPELEENQKVFARQEINGAINDSEIVEVRNHREDYPDGLPAPVITPDTIYQCASRIAVQHVPGAKLTVFTNDELPSSRSTSTGYSVASPGKQPFEVDDKFVAEIQLCEDTSRSAPVLAIPAPRNLAAPVLEPRETYIGQELIDVRSITNGATTLIADNNQGELENIFSWPLSWYNNYDIARVLGQPLEAGNQLVLSQKLCEGSPETRMPPPIPCEELPAPRVRQPIAGENFIVINEAVSGARIKVYDAQNNEIGDGAGTVIRLRRELRDNDVLVVMQQLGKCSGKQGLKIPVSKQKQEKLGDKKRDNKDK